jgi:NitT/TauT family transport system substrate-binding protein
MTDFPLGRMRILAPLPWLPAGCAHFALMRHLGYGAEEGIEVSTDCVGSPEAAVAGIARGEGEVCFVNCAFVFVARDRGQAVKTFASYSRRRNRTFGVPLDSPIRSIADLKGATVGLNFSDLLYLARAALRDAGLDPEKDVRFVDLPGDPYDEKRMVQPVKDGAVQALWLLDTTYGQVDAAGVPMRPLPSPRMEKLTPASCLFTSDGIAKDRRDALAAFGRAFAKASVFAETNPEATVRILWAEEPRARPAPGEEAYTLKRDMLVLRERLACAGLRHTADPRWGAIDGKEMADWAAFLLEVGEIAKALPATDYFVPGLTDDFNDFDEDAVREEARGYRIG